MREPTVHSVTVPVLSVLWLKCGTPALVSPVTAFAVLVGQQAHSRCIDVLNFDCVFTLLLNMC